MNYINYINYTKTPSDSTCLGEPLGGFCDVGYHLHFVVALHLSFFFIHIFFSTSSLSLPWTIVRFLDQFCTFSPAYRRAIHNTFIFQPFHYLFTEGYGFEWAFFTHRRFLPYAPSRHFWHNLLLSRPPWEPAVLP